MMAKLTNGFAFPFVHFHFLSPNWEVETLLQLRAHTTDEGALRRIDAEVRRLRAACAATTSAATPIGADSHVNATLGLPPKTPTVSRAVTAPGPPHRLVVPASTPMASLDTPGGSKDLHRAAGLQVQQQRDQQQRDQQQQAPQRQQNQAALTPAPAVATATTPVPALTTMHTPEQRGGDALRDRSSTLRAKITAARTRHGAAASPAYDLPPTPDTVERQGGDPLEMILRRVTLGERTESR
jgi:hypothetical protein